MTGDMTRRIGMAVCVALFAAAIAVAALTGRLTLPHLVAIGLAYLAASGFVAYLVADSGAAGNQRRPDLGAPARLLHRRRARRR